eukprot:TRINITY_DN7817_c0_g1_i1.p1 TRINITY_DN7817_c0_g1~~TRINITY_DN7817_c0_g1_i1.p1  ORF type:complete len:202 (-),score=22.23 TRINITY_DN7817_c0_g1_i1:39-644(-)
MSDCVLEGYLMKRGGVVKTWKRRYFRLENDPPMLRYYDEHGKETGHIELGFVTEMEDLSTSLGTPVFAVEGAHRRYLLQAESVESMLEWFEAIRARAGSGEVRVVGSFAPQNAEATHHVHQMGRAQTHSERAVIKEGALEKLGSKVKVWKPRYCKLMGAPYHELKFFEPRNLDLARGCIGADHSLVPLVAILSLAFVCVCV